MWMLEQTGIRLVVMSTQEAIWMNAFDAVEIVLADAEEPLGYREITRRVLEQGLWQKGALDLETLYPYALRPIPE